MALTDWQLIIYAATQDSGAGTAYDTVSTATIAGYTGYVTASIYIVKPEWHRVVESNTIADVSGATFGKARFRKAWNIESYPFRYDAGGTQDLDDIETLADAIDGKPYLWARILGGTRTYPSTSSTAHPVNLISWDESLNLDAGTRRLNLVLEHRYRI